MLVSAIVAMSRNRVIGRQGQIPWYLPADLKYFKRTTIDRHVIMGRKTFQSIGKPLPKRTNLVITRDPFFIASGIVVANSLEEALEIAYDNGEQEAFIIGGGEIYEESQVFWDRLYLTEVDLEVEGGDAFFPEIDLAQWRMVRREKHTADENNEYGYTFVVYERLWPEEEEEESSESLDQTEDMA